MVESDNLRTNGPSQFSSPNNQPPKLSSHKSPLLTSHLGWKRLLSAGPEGMMSEWIRIKERRNICRSPHHLAIRYPTIFWKAQYHLFQWMTQIKFNRCMIQFHEHSQKLCWYIATSSNLMPLTIVHRVHTQKPNREWFNSRIYPQVVRFLDQKKYITDRVIDFSAVKHVSGTIYFTCLFCFILIWCW